MLTPAALNISEEPVTEETDLDTALEIKHPAALATIAEIVDILKVFIPFCHFPPNQ